MGLSLSHLLVLLAIVFILFGAGKLPSAMKDIGKGLRNLREGMKSEDEAAAAPQTPEAKRLTAIQQQQAPTVEKNREVG